jgi:hypothetical protein
MGEIEDRVNIEIEIYRIEIISKLKFIESKIYRNWNLSNQIYIKNIENMIQNDKNQKITIQFFSIQN